MGGAAIISSPQRRTPESFDAAAAETRVCGGTLRRSPIFLDVAVPKNDEMPLFRNARVKEAVYKAFYPRTRTFWSFQDVGVSIDLEAGSYLAQLAAGSGLESVTGRVALRFGWIVSAVAVEAE